MSQTLNRSFSFFTALLLLQAQNPADQPAASAPPTAARELYVTVGKSLLVDSPTVIQRVSVANGAVAEAIATTPREVLVNGKTPGETSLIVWQQNGNRLIFDLIVQASSTRLDNVNRELRTEMGDQKVAIAMEDGVPFLRGTVNDLMSADRAVLIASALGKPVNLLRVKVPPVEAQILIKVRFADVDRTYSQQLGLNFFTTGAGRTIGSVTTGQFTPPQPQSNSLGGSSSNGVTSTAGQSAVSREREKLMPQNGPERQNAPVNNRVWCPQNVQNVCPQNVRLWPRLLVGQSPAASDMFPVVRSDRLARSRSTPRRGNGASQRSLIPNPTLWPRKTELERSRSG